MGGQTGRLTNADRRTDEQTDNAPTKFIYVNPVPVGLLDASTKQHFINVPIHISHSDGFSTYVNRSTVKKRRRKGECELKVFRRSQDAIKIRFFFFYCNKNKNKNRYCFHIYSLFVLLVVITSIKNVLKHFIFETK